MILKSCVKCGKLIPYGRKRCDECQKLYEVESKSYKTYQKSRYLKNQDPKYDRFYHSPEWIALRHAFMQSKNFNCERCGILATQAHHKIPIKVNWNMRLLITNLEALCDDCHNEEHGRFKRRKPHSGHE